jgi:molecular chaperone DnaK (HSP70)
VGYGLGIDVGTTFTAAAFSRSGRIEIVPLANYGGAVPSVIFVDGDEILFGIAAEHRGASQPLGFAREFKRRLADPTPLMLSGSPFDAYRLTALMAKWVVDTATAHVGAAPAQIVMTHPAHWTEHQLGALQNALIGVGQDHTALISEPVAAALDVETAVDVPPGSTLLIYDLGGHTLSVALLRQDGDTFTHAIHPAGIDHLGGVDFDEAVFEFVWARVSPEVVAGSRHNPELANAIAQVRRRCVDAKESLSWDFQSEVTVVLPGYTATVSVTRPQFEEMIRPMIDKTIDVVEKTLDRSHIEPSALGLVLLMGGSSRIPLISNMISDRLGVPTYHADPKLTVARGAARWAAMLAGRQSVPEPTPFRAFISYRRDDSEDVTGRIRDRLKDRFGSPAVFMDIDSIPPGVDFRKDIAAAIEVCDVVLVVIGQKWLETSTHNKPRIHDEGDVVRQEIRSALARDIPTIPVLVQRAALPSATDLPDDIKNLAFRTGLPVRPGADFDNDIARLVGALDDIARAIGKDT